MRLHGHAQPMSQCALVKNHVVEARRQTTDPTNARTLDIFDGSQSAYRHGKAAVERLAVVMAIEPLEGDGFVAQVSLEDAGVLAHCDEGVEADFALKPGFRRRPEAEAWCNVYQWQQLFAHATGTVLDEEEINLLIAEIGGGTMGGGFVHHFVSNGNQFKVKFPGEFF